MWTMYPEPRNEEERLKQIICLLDSVVTAFEEATRAIENIKALVWGALHEKSAQERDDAA